MVLRITTDRSSTVTVVRVDGRLGKKGAAELERTCESIEGPFCLDLANLHSIDCEGVRVISNLEAHGVALTGRSPYVDMLLKRVGRS